VQQFQWDQANIGHIARHGVEPAEAEQVILNDPLDLTFEASDGEQRVAQLGEANSGRVLVVVSTWRGDLIRVITANPAGKRLSNFYATQRGLYSARPSQNK
jgi:uncharacterized DUF497 family protein